MENDNPLYDASEFTPSNVSITPDSVVGSENSISQLSGAYRDSVPIAFKSSAVIFAMQVNGLENISLVDTVSLEPLAQDVNNNNVKEVKIHTHFFIEQVL